MEWLQDITSSALGPVSDRDVEAAIAELSEKDEIRDVGAVYATVDGGQQLIVLLVRQGYTAGPDLRDTVLDHLPCAPDRVVIVLVPAIPRSTPGSISPEPTAKLLRQRPESYDFTPPASDAERDVISLLNRLLSRERVSVNDDFVSLGGDSIAAIELVNLLDEQCGISLDPQTVFAAGSVREMIATAAHVPDPAAVASDSSR